MNLEDAKAGAAKSDLVGKVPSFGPSPYARATAVPTDEILFNSFIDELRARALNTPIADIDIEDMYENIKDEDFGVAVLREGAKGDIIFERVIYY
jgi:hypothetical protein